MEYDLTGTQSKVWKMIRNRKADVNESGITDTISKEIWTEYFKTMYNGDGTTENLNDQIIEELGNNKTDITREDIRTTVMKLKGRKASGMDGIANEMLQFGGHDLIQELLKFVRITLQYQRIPIDMKTSITIPISNQNYRITILSTVLKLTSKMGCKNINIVCYADDAVLASSEDDLQRILHQFLKSAKMYHMRVSKQKTKCLTTSREPLRYKLEIKGTVIEQVMSFKYLGINISSARDIQAETKDQAIKGHRLWAFTRYHMEEQIHVNRKQNQDIQDMYQTNTMEQKHVRKLAKQSS